MDQKETAVILLGVNGTLSEAVIRNIDAHRPDVDMFGFDVQQSTDLPVHFYQRCDLRSRDDINRAVNAIPFGEYSDIRLLICAALMNKALTFEDAAFDEDTLYEEAQINLVGPAHFSIAFARRCREAGSRGRIILIGSTAAYVGSRDAAYSMAKAGMNGLTRSISKNLAPYGVVSMTVHTGIFQSGMEQQVSESRKAQTVGMTHIKRKADVEEIRSFVQYYLLEAPDFATGMIVDISGGQHT